MPKKKDASPKPFSPFSGLVSEMLEPGDHSAIRVDRDDELRTCVSAICERQNHLFVYGERGTGKSFLMQLVVDHLRSNEPGLFPCYVNLVRDLASQGHSDYITTGFPTAILRQLCVGLWKDLLNRSTAELRDTLSETPGKISARRTPERKIVEVYRLLRLEYERLLYNRENGFGVALGLKGSMKEARGKEWKTGPMIVSEFLDLLEELFCAVCQPRDIEKLILVCDEANLLPFRDQQDLLLRFVELFSAKRTQFVMVLRPDAIAGAQSVFSAFERFELKGFGSQAYVSELLQKHLANTNVRVTDEGVQVLWEVFAGHPLDTLVAARRAYDVAVKAENVLLDGRMLAVASANVLREMRALHEMR